MERARALAGRFPRISRCFPRAGRLRRGAPWAQAGLFKSQASRIGQCYGAHPGQAQRATRDNHEATTAQKWLRALRAARFGRDDKPRRDCKIVILLKAADGSDRRWSWVQPDPPASPTPRFPFTPHRKAAGSFLPAAFHIQSDLVATRNQLGAAGAVPSIGVSVTVESGAGMTAPSGCVGSKAPAPGRSGAIGGASGIGRGVPT